jgi:uncharacterized protein YllA (UPF0747 family)
LEKTPVMGWKKEEIQNWLRSKNITFEENEVKRELMEKVKKIKHNYLAYVIDDMAKKGGNGLEVTTLSL